MSVKAAATELQRFIYRSQVLSLFRKFVRETRGQTPEAGAELRREIRAGFERNRSAGPDLIAIKYLLSDGRQQLKQLGDMLGLQR
ncbi:hypothetical protein FOA52_013105 [Chlamydomonas sp. UWO 241]|nr:hypothetical protein FOA52_013105 [Chlamydomonas sp. UWO 241]